MIGKRKKFDSKLHEQNDGIAKTKIKEVLSCILKDGVSITENQNKYSVDLVLLYNNKIIGVAECERKLVWGDCEFPYDSIQFPERKAKFANLGCPVMFCMLNKQCNRLAVVMGKTLLNSPKKQIANKYIASGEYFFQVPTNKAMFFNV